MSRQNLDALTSDPLERLSVPRPVDRIDYLCSLCKGKRVLDLGAYDETEVNKHQQSSWRWLHAELAKVSTDILGVDSSAKIKEMGELNTLLGSKIVYGTVNELTAIVQKFKPEIIVAGELIEHTPDSAIWLDKLAKIFPHGEIAITTPNATSIVNCLLASISRENCHVDHLQVYSYKSLACLVRYINVQGAEITPYYYRSDLFRQKISPFFRPTVMLLDRLILGPLQWLFPLYSGGLILHGKFEEKVI
jgi:hypothetical protein